MIPKNRNKKFINLRNFVDAGKKLEPFILLFIIEKKEIYIIIPPAFPFR